MGVSIFTLSALPLSQAITDRKHPTGEQAREHEQHAKTEDQDPSEVSKNPKTITRDNLCHTVRSTQTAPEEIQPGVLEAL